MKKIIRLLSIFLIFLVLSACQADEQDDALAIDLGDASEFGSNINELENVSMQLDKEVYSAEGDVFEVEIENNSQEDISFGVEYILEYLKEDTWYTVQTDEEPAFILLLVTLAPGDQNIDEINLDFYEPLEKGKYRIIRNIDAYPMAAEFEVKE